LKSGGLGVFLSDVIYLVIVLRLSHGILGVYVMGWLTTMSKDFFLGVSRRNVFF